MLFKFSFLSSSLELLEKFLSSELSFKFKKYRIVKKMYESILNSLIIMDVSIEITGPILNHNGLPI